MKIVRRHLLTAIIVVGTVLPILGLSEQASAQESTASMFGTVVDASTGKPVPDAIIVATSPALQGEQTAISDDAGKYRISAVPPGSYTLNVTAPTFKTFEQPDIILLVGHDVRIKVDLLPEVLTGETIVVHKQIASVIDQGSTTTGQTFTKDFMERVAVGRTFEDMVESTPGAQNDQYGVSFGGATSPENGVFIDGVNAGDPALGTTGTTLPLEFLEQVEVKTGGYMPEFGNATGGVVNVITKIGGNEFHGTVFNYTTPFQLTTTPVGRDGQAITTSESLNYIENLGFEVGGPIIKDYLWFHVGFAPNIVGQTVNREFYERVTGPNGAAATNSAGQYLTQAMPQYNTPFGQSEQTYFFTTKLTFNPSENHRLTLGFSGSPTNRSGMGANYSTPIQDTAPSMNGQPSAFDTKATNGGYDLIFNYDGKFLNKHLLANAVVGYHRQEVWQLPNSADAANLPQLIWAGGPNAEENLSKFEPSLASICAPPFTSGADTNRCPVSQYTTGGAGGFEYRKLERVDAKLTLTGIFSLLGEHQLKAGAEFQKSGYYHRQWSSGGTIEQIQNNGSQVDGELLDYRRFGAPNSAAIGAYGTDINNNTNIIQGGYDTNPTVLNPANNNFSDQFVNYTYYNNYVLFAQDSWTLFDRLNISGGIRFDDQMLYGGSDYIVDGQPNGLVFSLPNVSPRIGVSYDFTGTGRSKIFASWGRFFELVPLDMADRDFPSQSTIATLRAPCSDEDPLTCQAIARAYNAATPEGLKPVQGQYTEQIEAGMEYQIFADLMAGLRYTNTREPRIIEDSATNQTASSYFISNITGQTAGVFNPVTQQVQTESFPTPQRNYDAITLYFNKALSKNFIGNASYTMSFLRGYYSGLFNAAAQGQIDPNINADWDLLQTVPNHYGPLDADRTHQFKFDFTYIWMVSKRWAIIPNVRFRASSGTPLNYLGPSINLGYGPGQVFILNRGDAGRTPWTFATDFGIKAEWTITATQRLDIGFTLLNAFDLQQSVLQDQNFVTLASPVNPVLGGTQADLPYIKNVNGLPVQYNSNFLHATAYQVPLQGRLDVKFTF